MSGRPPIELAADVEAGLRRLRLAAIRRQAPEVLTAAKAQRWAPEEVLRVLVEAEITSRDASNTRNRMTAARFPIDKTLDEFRLDQSSIPRSSHDYLITLEWIHQHENLCLVGPAGTGKSHYLIGLGTAAVTAGYKVRYFTAIELVEHLYRAVADNTVGRAIEAVCRNDLVIIDERLRPSRSHRLPTPVPTRRRRLRTPLHRHRITLTVRALGTLPPRPTNSRVATRSALPPRPHHHHHRRQLPAHPPHHPQGDLTARTFVGHQRGLPMATTEDINLAIDIRRGSSSPPPSPAHCLPG